MSDLQATKRNMEARWDPDVFAYSPATGEEYSAHPGDYFWMEPDGELLDSQGNTMILVRRRTGVTPLTA